MPERVLVTGASGFIARRVIRRLIESGHTVRGTVRSAAKGDALKAPLSAAVPGIADMELVEADLPADGGWSEAVKAAARSLVAPGAV